MIGTIRSVVLDTKNPAELAKFYAGVLGGKVEHADDTWSTLTFASGPRLAFQFSPEHEPPTFPDPRGSQQFHLDVEVANDGVDDAERKVVELGGTRVADADEDGTFRVFLDPAGHTFCLVWDSELDDV